MNESVRVFLIRSHRKVVRHCLQVLGNRNIPAAEYHAIRKLLMQEEAELAHLIRRETPADRDSKLRAA